MRYIIIYEKEVPEVDIEREKLKNFLYKYRNSVNHVIIRLDNSHIEIDIDTSIDTLKNIVSSLEEIGYSPSEIVEVDGDKEVETNWVERFLNLYSKGRFWEIHEMLEGVWKKKRDPFLRALILLAIPYVKLQMGQYDKARRGFLRFLEYEVDGGKYGIDINCIKEIISKMLRDVDNPRSFYKVDIKKCVNRE